MVSFFKPGVGQNIAMHASPTARNSAISVSAFPVHSGAFPHSCSKSYVCIRLKDLMNTALI